MHMTTQSKFCVFVILYLVYSASLVITHQDITQIFCCKNQYNPPLKHIQNLK